jgi:hypothetical protein
MLGFLGRFPDPEVARHFAISVRAVKRQRQRLRVQIECWFSILSTGALKGASFTSPAQLRQAIDGFIEVYNETAEPFEWTKAEVHPVSPNRYIANLRR